MKIARTLLDRALAFACLLALSAACHAAALKPRIVVLTDLSPPSVEPDDTESLIRLLVYADLFEVEGLVATTGWSSAGKNGHWIALIRDVIDAYEKDLPNLRKRSSQPGHRADESHQEIGYWPSPDSLRSVCVVGSQQRGMRFVGKENSSPGSDLLVRLAQEPDDRPIWVQCWGGGNTLAQAVWQMKQGLSPADLKAALRRFRVYAITDQDGAQKKGNVIDWDESSHQWMRREFSKDLLFIWDDSAWKFQNGTGRSRWEEYAAKIQGHGHLGALYPKYKYGVEGDTPAFLYVMPNGLNAPEHPGFGGWGGFFTYGTGPDNVTQAYVNHTGTLANVVTERHAARFYGAIFNDFAARMEWAMHGKGNRNPVVVFRGGGEAGILTNTSPAGSALSLDASQSYDPDGDGIRFSWWTLPEAGTYPHAVQIVGADLSRATIQVPADAAGKTIHVICEVTDDGAPRLHGYRRIVLSPGSPANQSQKAPASAAYRPRVLVLSDFPPLDVIPGGAGHGPAEKRSDPDDVQSMVRFLMYANEFDVEGLVASAGTFANIARKQNILDILNRYDLVDDTLRQQDGRYPTAEQLRGMTWQGRDHTWGKAADEIIGEARDSEASEAIIRVLDRADPRPVWVCVWGGSCELAQALWKVKKTRSPQEVDRILGALRVFMIGLGDKSGQDGSGQWMLDQFPGLFVIVSKTTYVGMFGMSSPFGNLDWIYANIREGHGPLGAVYPRSGFNPNSPGVQEGDTPSFMYLYSAVRGMNDPERPDQESWGGHYVQPNPGRRHWFDGPGPRSVSKWFPDMQKDFARRMKWCLSSDSKP
jgi:hypothetical protein